MRRNAIPLTPGQLRGYLAFAIFLLLAGCGGSHSAVLEVRHNSQSVTLSWTASTSQVVGYNVYRSYPPGAPFMKLTPQPIAGTQYIDTAAESGNTYTYYVTAVDSKVAESRLSGKTVVTVPIP